jgi:hypothetical protein
MGPRGGPPGGPREAKMAKKGPFWAPPGDAPKKAKKRAMWGGPGGPPKSALGALPAGGPSGGPRSEPPSSDPPRSAHSAIVLQVSPMLRLLFVVNHLKSPLVASRGSAPNWGTGSRSWPWGGPPGGPPGPTRQRAPVNDAPKRRRRPWGGPGGAPGGAPGGSLWGPGGLWGGLGAPPGGYPRGAPRWPPSLRTILPFWSRPPGGPPGGSPGGPRGPKIGPKRPFFGAPLGGPK